MALTVPEIAPTEATAGDTLRWNEVLSEYLPSGGWSLQVWVLGIDVVQLVAVADATSKHFEVTGAAATTQILRAGTYEIVRRVTSATEGTYTLAKSVIAIAANPLSATPGSRQSHAERTLAVIEAALEGRLTADIQNYSIEGFAASKVPVEELYRLRAKYSAEVARLRKAGKFGRAVVVQFNSTSGAV